MTKRWQLRRRDYNAACAHRKEFRALLAEHDPWADLAAHELVFGELVGNAVRYGEDPISVDVCITDEVNVRIRLENRGGHHLQLDRALSRSPALMATSGRGIQIVRVLVDTMTVEQAPRETCRVNDDPQTVEAGCAIP